MEVIRFEYGTDATGAVRSITRWREIGKYLEGVDLQAGAFKTFRKDRVVRYLDGAEHLLSDPYPEPPRLRRANDERAHIIFTGFAKTQRATLEAKAAAAGLRVCKTVTRGCLYLVAGPNAGSSKVADARSLSAYVLSENQFHRLLATGELPDELDALELTDC